MSSELDMPDARADQASEGGDPAGIEWQLAQVVDPRFSGCDLFPHEAGGEILRDFELRGKIAQHAPGELLSNAAGDRQCQAAIP